MFWSQKEWRPKRRTSHRKQEYERYERQYELARARRDALRAMEALGITRLPSREDRSDD
jgi:hypothetical protein